MTHHKHHHRATDDTNVTELQEKTQGKTQSVAAAYASFRKRQEYAKSQAAQFAATLDFSLDDFQKQAIDALESGHNVLVAAPTGAGKTVIADFAIHLAQQRNVKAFYTTPIKALSNQKYHELTAVYGTERVGLLTGDMSVNPDADIIVMTTEVLRNMIYERSTSLEALEYVVLDEIHYLADRSRGQVWEEVIIHLPVRVKIVGLSATVSNVEDFCAWVRSVRGDTELVVSEHRPVPLEQHVMTQRSEKSEPQLWDLYQAGAENQVNTELAREIMHLDTMSARRSHGRYQYAKGRHGGWYDMDGNSPRRYTPKRWAVIDELDFLDYLPCIYFIFSRAGCDAAVEQCVNAGLRLTSDEEARRIRIIVDDMVAGNISEKDAQALGLRRFRYALEQGFAPHHAGMVALFRQIVETLFEQGLIKAVFATETLALGINMPARSVVIEKLEKFNGEAHVPLTPGEFTQLTGRAGRRGIDVIGHAIIVDHPGFVPAAAASLLSKRVYPLHSSFAPTFNMAVNLLASSDYATARTTLDHSFAQWEANGSAETLASQIRMLEDAQADYARAFACDRGDFEALMRARMELSDLEKHERRRVMRDPRISQSDRRSRLQEIDARIAQLRLEDRNNPCHECPDFREHMRWGVRWVKVTRDIARLRDRYDSRTGSVARQFGRICGVLRDLGYLEGDEPADYAVSGKGQVLRRIYGEHDLVLAESLSRHLFDGLNPAQLSALASGFVTEPRRGEESGEPRAYPGGERGAVRTAVECTRNISETVSAVCEDHGLDDMPAVDFSMCDIVHAWAAGGELSEILHDNDMTGGDFVRECKRVIDTLNQIENLKDYLDDPGVTGTARVAATAMNRGVVAYSGIDS